jgi:Ca-activated chloride channel homolog
MNTASRSKKNGIRASRRGAVLILVAIFMVVLLGMAAFAVDIAYLQLTRVELRAATDAAAKAAASSFRTSQSTSTALTKAQQIALLNQVNGKGYILDSNQVQFGQVNYQANGTWKFTANTTPYYSARVNAALNSTTSAGRVNSFFGRIFGVTGYDTAQSATASHYEQQIILCLDRSHSMCFDLSGTDWVYPPGIGGLNGSLNKAPHSTSSRWAALKTALTSFTTIINNSALKPQVGMVTWGSSITSSSFEGNYTHRTFPATYRDVAFTTTYSSITTAANNRGNDIMLGGTNMAAGLDDAIAMMDSSTNLVAKKSIILMSDGMWNQGNNPTTSANNAKNKGYVIHTIGFIEDNSDTMEQIASITGGKSYVATNAAGLNAAFTELANTLPVVLTE